ncbi:hypothetical protein A9Q93_08885 [Nonlabens dokdonensis]|uniref:Uncharacterized protein n=1 Tax=Nonlabens dokdonensis TaxID=328515 RepID=A0A1Z8AU81_9FLAO|nr:hypothetical protein [Nonlabens dokdonensis]OUS13889.1 hypothetical protein A9Q93_08885 [Nonlabens dokdonensis]
MKIKCILLIFGLLIGNTTFANDHFNFVDDCIKVFSRLDKTTLEFRTTLENKTESELLKTAITEYNNELVLYSMNKLLKYSKSENSNIKEVTTDLRNLMTNLVQMNYEYLNFVTNSEYTKKELKKKNKSLIDQNKLVTGFFREISLGICMTLAKEKPNKEKNKQYSVLTLNERNLLNASLIEKFGKSVKKGTEVESKSPFEYSSRLVYEFLNMEWVFEKE